MLTWCQDKIYNFLQSLLDLQAFVSLLDLICARNMDFQQTEANNLKTVAQSPSLVKKTTALKTKGSKIYRPSIFLMCS